MKKFLYLIAAALCLLSLAGCGGASKADAPAQTREKVLRVGTAANYPPFEYFQEASKAFTGFDVELMRGLARETGYDRVEFVDMEFHRLLPALKEKKVDAVISCLTVNESRRKDVDFTEPYLESGFVVVSRADAGHRSLAALKGKRIAVEKGALSRKAAEAYTKDVTACGTTEECLRLVAEQKADFAVMDHYTGRFFVTHAFHDRLIVMAELPSTGDEGVAIAVARGNKALLDRLNEGLNRYRTTAAFQQLKTTYFGQLQ